MTQLDDAIAKLRLQIATERAQIDRDKAGLDGRERALEGKEQALKVLEEMRSPAAPVSEVGAEALSTDDVTSIISLDDLDGGDASKRKTLIDDVREVVQRFGGQEFSIAHAEAAMKRLGIEIAGKTPRSRIALTFVKLCDEGYLVRTFVGGGNVPHRYKLRNAMTEGEAQAFIAAESTRLGEDGRRKAQQEVPNSKEIV